MDLTRTREIINPHEKETPIHLVGVGATGSHLAMQLVRLGMMNLRFWDMDTVATHNLTNQMYTTSQVGVTKIQSLKQEIDHVLGEVPPSYRFHDHAFNPDEHNLEGIVFLLVDSMETRKQIWDKALKFRPQVKLVIEPRLSARHGIIHSVRPMYDVDWWEARWYPDDDVQEEEVSACGATQTMGPTAAVMAGMCAWQLVRWWNNKRVPKEILISLDPPALHCHEVENDRTAA